jgi:formate dehydrogenase gamma subunit
MRVRRFTATEILYHWAQALPYLGCLGTGIAMFLLGREGAAASWRTVAGWHRIVGLALIVLVLLVSLAGDRRRLFRNLREAWRWRAGDLVWLARAPLAGLGFKVELPPAGRFNPGQKLHIAVQSLMVPVFALTGAAMWWLHGGVVFWFVHVAAAAVVLPLVLGHLYLSLIARQTRKGLRGMLDGTVDREWARHHHPLWLAPPEAEAPRTRRRGRSLIPLAVALGVVAALAGLGMKRGPELREGVSRAVNAAGSLLPTEPLAGAHRGRPDLAACSACHDLTGASTDARCLSCHEETRRAREAKQGWHGKLEEACSRCHRGHGDGELIRFDRAAFNHRQARFDLEGAHRALACERCHHPDPADAEGRVRWTGLRFDTCAACHEDPHKGSLGADCTHCHDQTAWGGRSLRFRHDTDTSFPLVGKHRETECKRCHETGFAGAKTGCAACHENPHQPAFEQDCATCHTPQGWKAPEVRVDHSAFPLVGAHATLGCDRCHTVPDRFLGLGTHCADCHKDPHQGTLAPKQCADCHDERSWRPPNFRHDADTKFPLRGAHAALSCDRCHATKVFRIAATGCADCHKDPHAGSLAPKTCNQCHDERSWKLTTFDHARDSRFPLVGAHKSVDCARCHATLAFRPRPTDCASCHVDPHQGTLAPKACSTCHDENAWRPQRFDHARDARFPLDAIHRKVSCKACHAAPVYRPRPTGCADCHAEAARALRGDVVTVDGRPDRTAADPHAADVRCTDCHDPNAGRADDAAMANRCLKCHVASYRVLHLDRVRQIDLLQAERPGLDLSRLVREAGHNFLYVSRALQALGEERAGGR